MCEHYSSFGSVELWKQVTPSLFSHLGHVTNTSSFSSNSVGKYM